MGTIRVKEFTGGLDTRRMPVATTGAVLMEATNGHITRGGEFEKREAFVPLYTLPANTAGLAATASSLYVFGHASAPTMPSGVLYQRLQDPNDATNPISRILSVDLNAGKLYTTVEFEDGSRHMYYDGDYVESWADGYARCTATVAPNSVTPAVRGEGSFRLAPGASPSGTQCTSVSVAGIELMTASATYSTSQANFLSAIVTEINLGSHGFTASKSGYIVTIKAPAGVGYNGEPITVVVTGTQTVSEQVKISGGENAKAPTLRSLWVGPTEVIDAPVAWTSDALVMATDIAAAINAFTSTSGYAATASGRKVIIESTEAGPDYNGLSITYQFSNGFSFSDTTKSSGGSFAQLARGTYVKTISNKMYAVSGSVFYFSGIAAPTKWSTDSVGAGFIDMAAEISGAERLQAVAKYQNYVAIFAEETTIIEYVDPDPTLNRQVQVLSRTGTVAPKSVTQFGDRDIYYLDQTGLRSLQARDASNAAATTDIGVMVDAMILAKLRTMTATEKANIIGVIEPQEGRFWLIMKDKIFVLSYFPGSKVSGWTTYDTTYIDSDGNTVAFEIDDVAILNKRLYLRAGNLVLAYGGGLSNQIYDATVAKARLPYLDANDPTRSKKWLGIDTAQIGDWAVRAGFNSNREDAMERIGIYTETTYHDDKNPMGADSTHISLEFTSSGSSRSVLSSCVIHYEGDQLEDR